MEDLRLVKLRSEACSPPTDADVFWAIIGCIVRTDGMDPVWGIIQPLLGKTKGGKHGKVFGENISAIRGSSFHLWSSLSKQAVPRKSSP